MTQLYEVYSENLTNVGGGGPNRDKTTINWKHISVKTVDELKQICENDYITNCTNRGQTNQIIIWTKQGGYYRTQDLSFVMYYIKPITLL